MSLQLDSRKLGSLVSLVHDDTKPAVCMDNVAWQHNISEGVKASTSQQAKSKPSQQAVDIVTFSTGALATVHLPMVVLGVS